MAQFNHALLERFRRGAKSHPDHAPLRGNVDHSPPPAVNLRIREYYEASPNLSIQDQLWLSRPELPSSNEILDIPEGDEGTDTVVLEPNRKKGGWETKNDYLKTHYDLVREDALRPLREMVTRVKQAPFATEAELNNTVGIYDKVHVCGLTCSTRGIALRVTFSIGRIGKLVIWEQSKRLISGTLVVLTPANDMFKTTAIVATVAARTQAGLEQNPPELDLFVPRAKDLIVDPAKEYVMVEERSGFYEADRHTLLALQHMAKEPFPLSDHLVRVEPEVPPPDYISQQPRMNLATVFPKSEDKAADIDVLGPWPETSGSYLDDSQLQALRRILTKRLAIIQGPPGTGKTFVSVQAVKTMLANRKDDDPPIIIACQTNHAVDQMLRHIAVFEPGFARLGGQTKDREIIEPRSIYNLREVYQLPMPTGCLLGAVRKNMKTIEAHIAHVLEPLQANKKALNPAVLVEYKLLTVEQERSLHNGASQWVQSQLSNPNDAASPFHLWLGNSLVMVPPKQPPENFSFDYEDADLEFEQLKETEAENMARDEEDFETLTGTTYSIADNFTCRKIQGISQDKAVKALKKSDLWEVDEIYRGPVYRYLQAQLKVKILEALRHLLDAYNLEADRRRVGNLERNETILRQQKIIGMTTTGLSKYRGLLAALEPKIVLIEEAAETLEAPVAVACMPSVQHLILVGDHQQLRPHCHVGALQGRPYYLDVSLFERMVKNKVEFDTLQSQRRMVPEIRRVLKPIYGDLIKDHASVLDESRRPPVPGMAGINSFFFTHVWQEGKDENMSAFNQQEADMIVGFVEYLYYNGTPTKDITILTFYNGQRKKILSALRKSVSMGGSYFNVVTVDSYQGEENRVVLLSLTRSNDKHQIGFLSIINRVCVALSRAQCGFYIFGNGQLLYTHKKWREVIEIFAGHKNEMPKMIEPNRLRTSLPITCKKHGNVVEIKDASDWATIVGGCRNKCAQKLPCGHTCTLTCHPFEHDQINCLVACGKTLACGHTCKATCSDPCRCAICGVPGRGDDVLASVKVDSDSATIDPAGRAQAWVTFAREEEQRYHSQRAARAKGLPEVEGLQALSLEGSAVGGQTITSAEEPGAKKDEPEELLIDLS